MKLVLIALTLILCGIATGDQSPQQVRVSLQFIEVPHATLTDMLADPAKSSQALHDKAVALSHEGGAKLLETCMVTCRSGQKATLETIREEIYPTEYAPPGLPCSIGSSLPQPAYEPPTNPLFRAPTAFDTRNTGVTFEVEATSTAGGMINLRLSPEIVTRLRLETLMEHTDQWGDGSIRMPIYETMRFNTTISVRSGKFELVSALTPKANARVPAVSQKILVFVRADILPVPEYE